MSRPNFIPRTLVGANGARLFDIPGVYYPPEMLADPRRRTSSHSILNSPPAGYIPTSTAAKLLNLSYSGARSALGKHNCPFRIVRRRTGLYKVWRKKNVLALVSQDPILNAIAPGWLTARETLKMLACSRSTLQRYAQQKLIRSHTVRLPDSSRGGYRHHTLFAAADLPPLLALRTQRVALAAEFAAATAAFKRARGSTHST